MNDTFVKVDYDKTTDEVFGKTASGADYPPLKARAEGSPITEKEFNREKLSPKQLEAIEQAKKLGPTMLETLNKAKREGREIY